jgi:hypothetical protein
MKPRDSIPTTTSTPLRSVPLREAVDDVAKRRAVLEERGDVLEEDALGREVLDVADLRLEIGDVHGARYLTRCRDAPDANVSDKRGSVTPFAT